MLYLISAVVKLFTKVFTIYKVMDSSANLGHTSVRQMSHTAVDLTAGGHNFVCNPFAEKFLKCTDFIHRPSSFPVYCWSRIILLI